MPDRNGRSIWRGVSAAVLSLCAVTTACSERDRIDAYKPACEKIYHDERARLLGDVQALGRISVPANPTYAELRALFGPEDGHLTGVRISGCSRLVWRPMPYRKSTSDIEIGSCARHKAEGTFDLAKFREAFFSNRHPSAIEAAFDRATIDDEVKPAAVTVRSPFQGTLGGLPLDLDSQAFRRLAEEEGWQYAVRREPPPDYVERDACEGYLLVCDETRDVFYRYDDIAGRPTFRLTAGACDGRVQEIQIWDMRYSIEPVHRPPL